MHAAATDLSSIRLLGDNPMNLELPQEIVGFEAFLANRGLACLRREGPDKKFFGNRILRYGDGKIGVQIVLDRSIWFVDVADVKSRPDEWYAAALFEGSSAWSRGGRFVVERANRGCRTQLADNCRLFSSRERRGHTYEVSGLTKRTVKKAASRILTLVICNSRPYPVVSSQTVGEA